MIENGREIVGEKARGVRAWHTIGLSVSAAVVDEDFEVRREFLHHSIPHAGIERERMDEHEPRLSRLRMHAIEKLATVLRASFGFHGLSHAGLLKFWN